MRRLLLPLLALLLLAAPLLPLRAAESGVRVAVLYFENEGNPELDMLRLGLSQMMITKLAGQPGLTVMERGRINEVLGELDLQKNSAVDPETAVKLGELLGVDRLVMGGYLEVAGQFVLTGRVVDVQTGEVVGGSLHDGEVSDFVPMLSALSAELLPVLKAAPGPAAVPSKSDRVEYDFDEEILEAEYKRPPDAILTDQRYEEEEALASPSEEPARRGAAKSARKGRAGGKGGGAPRAAAKSPPKPAAESLPAPAPASEPLPAAEPEPVAAVPDTFAGAMALSLALDLIDRGDPEGARDELARALRLDPGLEEARLQLGQLDAALAE